MNPLQFSLDEDLGYLPISPDVIDISSESGEEFTVEPGNTAQLDEKFRIDTRGSNIMTAFMGSATASLFPPSISVDYQETIDTAGSYIEREIMELLEENPLSSPVSIQSFVDSEFEEVDMPPESPETEANVRVNSYGRPVAAILPIPRASVQQQAGTFRPVPTYPPNFVQGSSNFHQTQADNTNAQEGSNLPSYETEEVPYPITSDITPMVIHLPPRNMGIVPINFNGHIHQNAQFGFPFNILHSSKVLLMPVNARQNFRLFPTIMPNVAGFCDWCGRIFDQVALETLRDYLGATAYNEETVRDRGVRSRAFIDGFEAALFIFKNAGLSRPQRCDGSGVHQ